MRRRMCALSLCLVALAGFLSPAGAGPFDGRPKLLFHVQPVTSKNACSAGALADCRSAVVKGALTPIGGPGYYYTYLLAARGNLSGLRGIQCGIAYQNLAAGNSGDLDRVDVFSWTLCADLEFITAGPRSWPRPCGGTIITWAACRTEDTAVAGYFYMACYDRSDYFALRTRPVDNAAKVADCDNRETFLQYSELGAAYFSPGAAQAGCNPCNNLCNVTAASSRLGDPCVDAVEERAASIALHVAPNAAPSCSSSTPALCADIVTSGTTAPAGPGRYVYMLGDRGTGSPVRSIHCGITYGNRQLSGRFDGTGIDIVSWHSCATTESPSELWPAPGSSITLNWSSPECSTSRPLVAGYFYVSAFSSDTLRVTRGVDNSPARVTRCDNVAVNMADARLGTAVFGPGGGSGCNPCTANCELPIPVQRSTWGGIKALWTR